MRLRLLALPLLALCTTACVLPTLRPLDGGDVSTDDAGVIDDEDAGDPGSDAADPLDAGPADVVVVDAGVDDAGLDDAGADDAGADDAGADDAGLTDAGATDAGIVDGGPDAGDLDAGPLDSGTGYGGVLDPSFGDDGVWLVDFGEGPAPGEFSDIASHPNGGVVAVGIWDGGVAAIHVDKNGNLAGSFAGASAPLQGATSVAVATRPGGEIVIFAMLQLDAGVLPRAACFSASLVRQDCEAGLQNRDFFELLDGEVKAVAVSGTDNVFAAYSVGTGMVLDAWDADHGLYRHIAGTNRSPVAIMPLASGETEVVGLEGALPRPTAWEWDWPDGGSQSFAVGTTPDAVMVGMGGATRAGPDIQVVGPTASGPEDLIFQLIDGSTRNFNLGLLALNVSTVAATPVGMATQADDKTLAVYVDVADSTAAVVRLDGTLSLDTAYADNGVRRLGAVPELVPRDVATMSDGMTTPGNIVIAGRVDGFMALVAVRP
jgi:hypothetical protein